MREKEQIQKEIEYLEAIMSRERQHLDYYRGVENDPNASPLTREMAKNVADDASKNLSGWENDLQRLQEELAQHQGSTATDTTDSSGSADEVDCGYCGAKKTRGTTCMSCGGRDD